MVAGTTVCFGPWKVEASRSQLVAQVGFGVMGDDQAASPGAEEGIMRYYFELKSQGKPNGWRPRSDEWIRVSNATGGDIWDDGAVQTKITRPGETDWLRLWIQNEDWSVVLDSGGGGNQELLLSSGTASGTINFVASNYIFSLLDSGAAAQALTPTDFAPPGEIDIVIYDGTAGASAIRFRGAIANTTDLDADASDEAVALVGTIPFPLAQFDGLEYNFHKKYRTALRYVIARDEQLTTVDEDDATRVGVMPVSDESANIGDREVSSVVGLLQSNADVLAVGVPEPIVNQVLATEPRLLVGDEVTKYVQTYGPASAGWVTVWEHGFFAEQSTDTVVAQFTYHAQGMGETTHNLEMRLRILNDVGASQKDGDAIDFFPNIQVASVGHGAAGAGEGFIASAGERSFWPGPWWYSAQPSESGVIDLDVSGHRNAAYGIDLQLRTKGDAALDSNITVRFLSMHIHTRPRR